MLGGAIWRQYISDKCGLGWIQSKVYRAAKANRPVAFSGPGGQHTHASTTNGARPETPEPLHEYEFVSGKLIDVATLKRAVGLAQRWNVTPHDVLMANDWIRPGAYYRALARDCGAPFLDAYETDNLEPHRGEITPRGAIRSNLLKYKGNGRAHVSFAPSAITPGEMKSRLATDMGRVAITTPRDLRAGIQKTFARSLMSEAVSGLSRRYPGQSAGEGLVLAQRIALGAVFALISISAFMAPLITLHVLAGLVTLFFGLVVSLRLIACINLLVSWPIEELRRKPQRIADAELPGIS